MQLERLLHREGWSSRKGCRILINQGRVCVAGEVADDPGLEVEPEGLAYSVDDEAAIAREHPIPLRFIGVGEGLDDLRPFSARDYVDALFD